MKKVGEQDVVRLMKGKDHSDRQISALKQELEMAKNTYEKQCMQLETQAKETKVKLEKKLMELEGLLTDSRNRVKELEVFSESKMLRWRKKELSYKRILDSQFQSLQVCITCLFCNLRMRLCLICNMKLLNCVGIKGGF